jgi:hypothetical protein
MALFENNTDVSLLRADSVVFSFFGRDVPERFPPATQTFLDRFSYLLQAHDLQPAELLEVVPKKWQWSMNDVATAEGLLRALRNRELEWFCEFFCINRHWLNTGEDWSFWPIFGYKNIGLVLEKLHHRKWRGRKLRMSLMALDYTRKKGKLSDYLIVFSCRRKRVGMDKTVFAHAILRPEWRYGAFPARMDTKALARWFVTREVGSREIPIIPITRDRFDRIAVGKDLPGPFDPDATGGYDCFSDRVLWESESAHATEVKELGHVIAHMKEFLPADQIRDFPKFKPGMS